VRLACEILGIASDRLWAEIDKIWKEYRLKERTRLNVSDLSIGSCRVADVLTICQTPVTKVKRLPRKSKDPDSESMDYTRSWPCSMFTVTFQLLQSHPLNGSLMTGKMVHLMHSSLQSARVEIPCGFHSKECRVMLAKLASKTRLGIRRQMVARKISVKVCPESSALQAFHYDYRLR
jgi:hypothetical protein